MSETLNTAPLDTEFWNIVGEYEMPMEPDEDFVTGQEKLPIELPSQENK